MPLEITAWDSAEALDTPEAIAAYIEAALEEDDASLLPHALGVAARAKGAPTVAGEAGVAGEAL